ncbi:MAG: hypothetical protein AAF234_11650 [Pseudomonadota bacterium]
MDILKETLWDRLFNRLPENAANEAIRTLKRGGSFKDVDFLTLKEAEAQVAQYRDQAKAAIGAYRSWKTANTVKLMFGVFHNREGALLKAHARNLASLFLDARRDHADLTALLMHSVANGAPYRPPSNQGGNHDQ